MLVVMAIIAVLVSIGVPAIQQARETARDLQCRNNVKQVASTLHMFCGTHGKFPDSNNEAWTLPVADEAFGFQRGRNEESLRGEITIFRCPSDEALAVQGYATGNTGINSELPGNAIDDIRDGTSSTIMLSEMTSALGVPWSLGPLLFVAGINSAHPQTVNVSLADGSVRGMSKDIDEDVLRSLLTISGGEIVTEF